MNVVTDFPRAQASGTNAALEQLQSRTPAQPVGSGVRNCSYAVIGAGPGGLCAAKYLLQKGAREVVIYEVGSKIGGLWCYDNDNGMSSAYRTLHINTAKNITNFSDVPFDDDVQMFPDHGDMYRYLQKYADTFDLTSKVRFNARVTDIRPADGYSDERPVWQVKTIHDDTRVFDRVVVATGHLHNPAHVDIFRDTFGGEYLHSHYYKEPLPFVGKRICIVGIGNSAADIASDVCVNSATTVIVARSGVMIQPKMIFGIPFTDITLKLFKPWIPPKVRKTILAFLVRLVHGRMEQYGFRPVTERVHTTSNAVFMHHVAYNRVRIKHEIQRIEGKRIFFSDGTSEEFDVIIGATGYTFDLPFIASDIVEVKANKMNLYKRIVPPAHRGLYFLGFIQPTTALNLSFEHQARWIVALEEGKITLPDADSMREAIADKAAWVKKTFKDTPRHQIEEDHPEYFAELRVPNAKALFGYDLKI
jgi:dimethylaniline monooxygenase (N-oxide forming)